MKETVDALKGIAQFITLALTALALAALVFVPNLFASRLAEILRALDSQEITAKIKLPVLEAELNRLGDELTRSDDRAIALAESAVARGDPAPAGVNLANVDLWAVVAVSDPDLSTARRAIGGLEADGFETALIKSGDLFMATALLEGRVAAETGAAIIEELALSELPPYVRSLAVWCPTRVTVADLPGVERCAGSPE